MRSGMHSSSHLHVVNRSKIAVALTATSRSLTASPITMRLLLCLRVCQASFLMVL
jgi:hypothetical protein